MIGSMMALWLGAFCALDDWREVEVSRDDGLDLAVVRAETDLPFGMWSVADSAEMADVGLAVLNAEELAERGRRLRNYELERAVERGRWTFSSMHWVVAEFAKAHAGRGPANWEELQGFLDPTSHSWYLNWIDASSARYALSPQMEILDGRDGSVLPGEDSQPLMWELHPAIDDGKHWAMFADGSLRRVDIDAQTLHALGFTVTPGAKRLEEAKVVPMKVRLVGRLVGAPNSVEVTFADEMTGRTIQRRLTLGGAAAGGPDVMAEWATVRAERWAEWDAEQQSTLVARWQERVDDLYGGKGAEAQRVRRGRVRPSPLTLMGGQPAIRETLQLELIGGAESDDRAKPTIPLADVDALDVTSHPFEEMLEGVEVPPVGLASLVPADRAMVTLHEPMALGGFLDRGAASLTRLASLVSGNGMKYRLEERYTKALGLSPDLVRRFLEGGVVEEMVLFVPDLFFVDGTDITVIARLSDDAQVDMLLTLGGLAGDRQAEKELQTLVGSTAHWARRDSLLFLSTSKRELTSALALHQRQGAGSLGMSAEYAFMLSRVPTTETTVARAYLSDAFLRRLTGPEVKVGQLRRAREQVAMEAVVAGRLLRRADGHEPGSIAKLAEQGYIPSASAGRGLEMLAAGTVQSPVWGRLDRLEPLSAHPVTHVTEAEKEMYGAYVNNYQRYWRRFYDPIAITYEAVKGGEHAIETFILPLLDSSIYSEMREILPSDGFGPPLRVPQVVPEPVVTMSVQIPEQAFGMVLEGVDDMLDEFAVLDPVAFDLLGNQIHLLMQDDEPMIRMGGSELLGLMAGSRQNAFDDDFLWAPLAAAFFTRPCDVLMEVSDPNRMREILGAARTWMEDDDWVSVTSYRIEPDGRVLVSLDVLGVVKWDFSLEVQGDWLVLSNHPWTGRIDITGTMDSRLTGAVVNVNLESLVDGLAASHASYAEQERSMQFRAMARLMPWLAAGAEDPEMAVRRSLAALGRAPHWTGDDLEGGHSTLTSHRFGQPGRAQQPIYTEGEPFGLLQDVRDLKVEVQLEEDGLRSLFRWTPRSR